MTNYQNEIMDLLQGDTPKQKYDFLKQKLSLSDSSLQHIMNHFKDSKDIDEFLSNLDKLLSGITWDGKRKIQRSEFAISGSMVIDMKCDNDDFKRPQEREPYYLQLRKMGTVTQD